ncbi:MAG: AraC family ligand binding domain-containing protein, partial [Mycetocola sp.]
MPILRQGQWLHPGDRPDWCEIGTIGRFSIPFGGGRFDRHHHDDHEIWFIAAGKGKVAVGDTEHYVSAGDIVLIQAGLDHDIVEVYEPLSGFFTETGHPGGGRVGHLHRTE